MMEEKVNVKQKDEQQTQLKGWIPPARAPDTTAVRTRLDHRGGQASTTLGWKLRSSRGVATADGAQKSNLRPVIASESGQLEGTLAC